MSNTKKSIVFIISLFTFLIILTVLNPIFIPLITPDNLFPVNSYIWIIALFIALLSQAITRKVIIQNDLKKDTILYEYKISPFKITDRIIILIIPFAVTILPILFSNSDFSFNYHQFIAFFIFLGLVELSFFKYKKSMKLVITNNAIAIVGFDLRIELPISANYQNGSGYYGFERIEGYLIINNEIILKQSYDLGNIKFICNNTEEARQIKGLLIKNGVYESRNLY